MVIRVPSGITPGSTATTPYPVGAPVAVRPWIEYPVASTVIVGPFTPGAGVGPFAAGALGCESTTCWACASMLRARLSSVEIWLSL